MATNRGKTAEFSGEFSVNRGNQVNVGHLSGQTIYIGAGNTGSFSKLSYVDKACFDSRENEKKGLCLPGTRVDLLKDIVNWYHAANGKHIFWLSGLAGTGKSTIARTVARIFQDANVLAASFFFSRDYGDTQSAESFVTTIARQLTELDPSIKETIENTMNDHPRLTGLNILEQWWKLVLHPLAEFQNKSANQEPLLFVIDALDECACEDDISLIIHILAQIPQACGDKLLVFLTSRPEYAIRPELSSIEHRELKLQSVNRNIVDQDICLFISNEFQKITSKLQIGSEWPGAGIIARLVEGAAGLFIWAATACRYVQLGRTSKIAFDRLKNILQGIVKESTPQEKLYQIYTSILTASITCAQWDQSEQDKQYNSLRKILGAIVLLLSPLSVDALGKLIKESEIESTLSDLHSILDIPKSSNAVIRLHHPSFRDFLLNTRTGQLEERDPNAMELCLDTHLHVDEEEHHRFLADSCLELMGKALKRDICGLKSPGILRSEIEISRLDWCIPLELRYACFHWVVHLHRGRVSLFDGCNAHLFLKEHLLHWMEILCLFGNAFDIANVIDGLRSMEDENNASDLKKLLSGARRFTLNACRMIDDAPLQLYCSALLFCPSETSIRRIFEEEIPRWISLKPQVSKNWESFHVLKYDESAVQGACESVVFSPNGKYVASVFAIWFGVQKAISIWETSTGRRIGYFLNRSPRLCVCFSSDSSYLTCGLFDYSFNETCRKTYNLKGHVLLDRPAYEGPYPNQGSQRSLVSPDGSLEAVYVPHNIWHLKNVKSGEILDILTSPHEHIPLARLAFSPDSNQIASMNQSGDVLMLDTRRSKNDEQAVLPRYINGNPEKPIRVEISGHGNYAGVFYLSDHVEIWGIGPTEARRLATVKVRPAPDDDVAYLYIALSPDEKYVSFKNNGYEIDALVSERTTPKWSSRHGKGVSAGTFSPDSRYAVYGHTDGFITILHVPSGQTKHAFRAHEICIDYIVSSSSLVASCAWDQDVKLWDIETGHLIRTFRMVPGFCGGLAIIPDERKVLMRKLPVGSTKSFETLLWDVNTGKVDPAGKEYGRRLKPSTVSPSGDPASLLVSDQWVMASGRRLIHLPDNRKSPVDISVFGNTIVMISSHFALVTIIGLDGREPYEI